MNYKRRRGIEEVMKKWQMLMVAVPKYPDISVPEGWKTKTMLKLKSGEKFQNSTLPPKITLN